MPFRHVVMLQIAEGLGAEYLQQVSDGLDELPGLIDVIREYRHGPDVGISPGNYDYVVVGDFDSADDYIVYRDHPAHRKLITELLGDRVVSRAAVQYEY